MKIVNLGILAHVDAGKTTLTEAILHLAGAVRVLGRVDEGTTITDSMAVERERGITVRASTVSFSFSGVKVNILDTPGHMDFIAEVERSLRVLDAAILVLSAREGVQTQTRRLFAALKSLNIPTILFINKLDRAGADPDAVLRQIRESLTTRMLPIEEHAGAGTASPSVALTPLEQLSDALAEADDDLLEHYIAGESITRDMLQAALGRAVKSCAVYPVLFGAALKETGVRELLDAIANLLPGADAPGDPLIAEIYKVDRQPRLGRVCYARVWSGTLRRGAQFPHAGEWLRVKQLMALEDARLKSVEMVPPGDIAALVGLDSLNIGDVIAESEAARTGRTVSLAQPLLYSKVTCAPADRSPVLAALCELADEDPLLQVEIGERTEEILIRIFGEVQMEIIVTLLRERFGLTVALDEPRTIFREKPLAAGRGEIVWGETHYPAALALTIEPWDADGIEYETKVDYGYLQQSFQTAVRDGVMRGMKYGAGGWQVFGAKVTLTSAVYDSVSSTPAAYRIIAPKVVKKALAQCGARIYEPFVTYQLRVPADCAARAAYDLSVMRGVIDSTYAEGEWMVYEGTVPLETSRSYPRALASYTKGLGILELRPADYRPYPGKAEDMARAMAEADEPQNGKSWRI